VPPFSAYKRNIYFSTIIRVTSNLAENQIGHSTNTNIESSQLVTNLRTVHGQCCLTRDPT
jgi:hypothetical protein